MDKFDGKIVNTFCLKSKHNRKLFNGFVTNKRGYITYYKYSNVLEPKGKPDRPVYIAINIKGYTYYLRIQGVNGRDLKKISLREFKKQKKGFMNGLYVKIKKNQFGYFPIKDSIICIDVIFRVKSSKIDNLINDNNKIFNETLQATYEFQIDILKRLLEVTKNPPDNFFYIEYDEHKFFQKYLYDEKEMVINDVAKILYGNINGLEKEIKNTMDNDITSIKNLDELKSSLDNPLFIKKSKKYLKELGETLKEGIQIKEKELNSLKENNTKEQLKELDEKIEDTKNKFKIKLKKLNTQKQLLLNNNKNDKNIVSKRKKNNERER